MRMNNRARSNPDYEPRGGNAFAVFYPSGKDVGRRRSLGTMPRRRRPRGVRHKARFKAKLKRRRTS